MTQQSKLTDSGKEPPGDAAGQPRLIVADETGQPLEGGNAPYVRIGEHRPGWRDVYHALLTVRWRWFLLLVLLGAVAANAGFATLYLLMDGGIEGAQPGSFSDAFYFSVQTMSTVGYGTMHPRSHIANLLASAEAMLGMTGFALGAAVMFARLSRPNARILFSRVAVIGTHEGRPALMFRAANQRYNHILQATVFVTLIRTETTAEGEQMRRFHELPLVHAQTPVFTLPWTIIHHIDEGSPLSGATPASLAAAETEIIVLLAGIDDAFSQTVHARKSYIAGEVLWGMRFADVLTRTDAGRIRIDFRRFHDTLPDRRGGERL
ncbi:MAG TPA: ion channel [Stellaceae bacterium]